MAKKSKAEQITNQDDYLLLFLIEKVWFTVNLCHKDIQSIKSFTVKYGGAAGFYASEEKFAVNATSYNASLLMTEMGVATLPHRQHAYIEINFKFSLDFTNQWSDTSFYFNTSFVHLTHS